MKRCPECRRDYYDDTLLYCLDDGNPLLEGPASGSEPSASVFLPHDDEPQTAILHGTAPPGEAATRAQIHTTEQTAVLPSGIAEVPKEKSFDKRLLLVPLALAVIVLGGFFGYRYFSAANSKQINSIAVMPFENKSGDPEVEYLSDGMAETLISSLTTLPDLDVKPRSTVFRYKGKDMDPRSVGKELNVQAVLSACPAYARDAASACVAHSVSSRAPGPVYPVSGLLSAKDLLSDSVVRGGSAPGPCESTEEILRAHSAHLRAKVAGRSG